MKVLINYVKKAFTLFFFFTTIGANEEQVKDGLRFTF